LLACPFQFSSFMIGAASNYQFTVRATCASQISEVPMAPMGDSCFAHCLQGGGVYVQSGTVMITSSSITGNTAYYVRAHVQKFPSPRWENCAPMGDSRFARCLQGGGVAVWGGTVSIVNSQIYSNTATPYVRTDIRNFPSPRWETHISLVNCKNRAAVFLSICRAVVSLSILAQCQL
jgi:hypothetical protein